MPGPGFEPGITGFPTEESEATRYESGPITRLGDPGSVMLLFRQ